MNPVEVIIKKRNGEEVSRELLQEFISDYIGGRIDGSQMSALLMAIYFQGMTVEETWNLTDLYISSGQRIEFPGGLVTVDKHSTGGVGDKISLMLAPILAASGAYVPMISGRGLGHTGGTLDKLESIPGFRTDYTEREFKEFVMKSGLAIISQSEHLVPADRLIYALRDTTGTVESLPLITASIMSKKIAEGARHLVIDLKVGRGAFMSNLAKAQELGDLLQSTGERFGQKVSIVYTNMNSPLGFYCGNALEVLETINYLKGEVAEDIDVITRKLAREALILSGISSGAAEADMTVERVLADGSALEKFRVLIKQQGGDERIIEEPDILPQPEYVLSVVSEKGGYVQSINSRQIGYALVETGAGRKRLADKLDMAAGAYLPYKTGDRIEKGEELGRIYCNDKKKGLQAVERVREAYELTEERVEREKIILL